MFGTLPDDTNTKGQASFAVLLGSNDKGTATVTVSLDQSNDGDFTDAIGALTDDITTSASITVGASTAGVVNVGSFSGKLVVYAKNLDGAKISWKVGGKWGTATAVGNTLNSFVRTTPKKGVTVSVDIYVNGVKTLTKSVVTR